MAPETDRAPIDEAALALSSGGDPALERDLLQIFRDAILPEAARLASLDDTQAKTAVAHKVKGAALAVGATRLAALVDPAVEGQAGWLAAEIGRVSDWIDGRLLSSSLAPGRK